MHAQEFALPHNAHIMARPPPQRGENVSYGVPMGIVPVTYRHPSVHPTMESASSNTAMSSGKPLNVESKDVKVAGVKGVIHISRIHTEDLLR